ncbi:LamG domain-containing protein [Pontibacter sp. HSC-36F09]|uniref:LamG domain-containing protein n=1 Tax=Pontibacter sp. HSC-36F09 TaxID=2910966 RepID=UPI00209CD331|nr:LamG domain-containing protein [Pontibacter sp. HSC-36F09]MCP2043375.1 hypothetical protein [Pontibacter sp. HSC-36F09]
MKAALYKRNTRYNPGIAASLCGLLALICVACVPQKPQPREALMHVWQLHTLEEVGGHVPEVWGAPRVVAADKGRKSVAFDGEQDGLLVPANPIAGARAFEIEVVFKPASGYPANVEQRFLHIQEPDNPDRRLLIELRLNNKQQWYADFFMRTEKASLTLLDSTKTHPVNEWATIKLRYKDGVLTGFVNGKEEVSGAIEYLPIADSAYTSIGTRMDKRSLFKGAIREVWFRTE